MSLTTRHCERSDPHRPFLILRSAERASRRMKARLSASPFETRADSALLRVRVYQLTTHSAVVARLDRAIQYAAASPYPTAASGILDPRWSLSSSSPKARPGGGDHRGNCISRSDANELK
jgi:hypothetical protein